MASNRVSVLITRPQAQAVSWRNAVEQQGWQAVCFPTLAIKPLPLTPQDRDMVLNLDRYNGVIVISGNAAELGLAVLSDYWPQWPIRQDWYAVGPATAEALRHWHLQPQVPGQHDSDGLLGLAGLRDVTEKKFLILKGKGGRETLRQKLLAGGARVDELVLYERCIPESSLEPLLAWLAESADKRYITISSGDGLKNLLVLAGEQGERLKRLPLVVVSERLAEYARQQGFASVLVAPGASAEAVIAAIKQDEAN